MYKCNLLIMIFEYKKRTRKDCMKKKPGRKKKPKSYYKKKRGRHKKPGPKKKKNPVGRPPKKTTDKPKVIKKKKKKTSKRVYYKKLYHIILTSRKKRIETLARFTNETEAYSYFYEVSVENKNVVFPVRYLNYKGIIPSDYEIYIIKQKEDSDDDNVTKLRDEYGELIEHETDNEKWIIVDKKQWEIEETFWVFGHHPLYDRKTFSWIFDDFIVNTQQDKYDFRNVIVYNNKFIVDCVGDLKIAFCKNMSDANRMYDMVEKMCAERKYKHVLFSGNLRSYSRKFRQEWIDRLCEFTSFNRTKIKRTNLRP